MTEEPNRSASEWLLSNEFATVQVRLAPTRNGIRLEIVSAKLGYRVALDPLILESLTWQPPEFFSRLLETPFGPESDQPVVGHQ